jgi:hypothetical protein
MDLIFTVFCFYYFEKHVGRGRESAGNRLVRLRGFRVTPYGIPYAVGWWIGICVL